MTDIVTLGLANTRQGPSAFGVALIDRLNHQYIIGQTGTGKSTMLANMAIQDAQEGHGFCLIDPHGDLAEEIAAAIRAPCIHWRVGDPTCPYGYNPISRVPPSRRPLVASGFVETLKKQWGDSWGPRMEHLLRQATLALLDQPTASMADIVRLYVDKSYRVGVVARLVDPQLRAFWTQEFPRMNYLTVADFETYFVGEQRVLVHNCKKPPRQQVFKQHATRKEAKDARPRPYPQKKGAKQATRQSKNKDGTGNRPEKHEKGSRHFHDRDHDKKNRPNKHEGFPD